MLFCDGCSLESWSPDFSGSGQNNPSWTRVRQQGEVLCNSLEGVAWTENPVQVVICEGCGFPSCADGNFTHVSRLEHHVLWTVPQNELTCDWETIHFGTTPLVEACGAVAIAAGEWERWNEAVPELIDRTELPEATGRALGDAWRLSAGGPARAQSLGHLVPLLRERLLHSDHGSADEAIEKVSELVRWLGSVREAPLRGAFASPAEAGAEVDHFYLDGYRGERWAALALTPDRPLLAFGKDTVFVPE